MRMRGVDLTELVEKLLDVIEQYLDDNPGFTADEAAAALSYTQGAIFRLASDVPPSGLN